MRKGKRIFCVFMYGAAIYSLIEIIWRGHTHWTMAITGGICLLLLHYMDNGLGNLPFLIKCLCGALLISFIEFTVGVVVNLLLGMEVWDYSDQWGNILGQICPVFTGLWFILCIPALLLARKISAIVAWDKEYEESETVQ